MAEIWKEFAVIVIEPELEAWLMNENAAPGKDLPVPEKLPGDLG